jgi:hypothetical protein
MKNGKSRNLQLLLRQIILSFLAGSGLIVFFLLIQAIVYEQLLSTKIPWEIIVSAFTIIPVIVIFLNAYINQEIKQEIEKEKAKLLEENSNLLDSQTENNNLIPDLVKKSRKAFKTMMEEFPELETSSDTLKPLLDQLDKAVQSTPKYSKDVRKWLQIENLDKVSKHSCNVASNVSNPLQRALQFIDKKKYEDEIYNCLIWIRESWIGSIYLTSLLPKISDKDRTIRVLKYIKTEVLAKELEQELGGYFDRLCQLIAKIK